MRTLCLGYLSMREASGYQIKKDFEDGLFSHFIEASYGSIYPALNQLAVDGLVTVREEEQSGKPDKKVYAITDHGHAALARCLAVIPARDKYKSEFLFEMLLKHYLTPEHTEMAIQKQYADVNEDLATIAACRADSSDCPGSDFVLGYGEAVLNASKKYLEKFLKKSAADAPTRVAAE